MIQKAGKPKIVIQGFLYALIQFLAVSLAKLCFHYAFMLFSIVKLEVTIQTIATADTSIFI